MPKIPLPNGKFALVDSKDFKELSKYKWSCMTSCRNTYARRTVGTTSILMHRQIMGHPKSLIVDHKNRNGLDNRRRNLRLATGVQNNGNSAIPKNNTSGYKGVRKCPPNKWSAEIGMNGKIKWLGTFRTLREAKKAYRDASLEYFGKFARVK